MSQIPPEYKMKPNNDAERARNVELQREAQTLAWLDDTINTWGT